MKLIISEYKDLFIIFLILTVSTKYWRWELLFTWQNKVNKYNLWNLDGIFTDKKSSWFFIKIYLFLSEWQTHRKKPHYPSVRSWADPKPGARSFLGSSTWVQGPNTLGHLPLLSQATYTELNGKWSSQDMNWCPKGILAHARGGF